MKNLLFALLFTFPLITNASVINADSFKVELPTFFSEVTEEKSEGRTSWSFTSKYGDFLLTERQCEGCPAPSQTSVTESLNDPSDSDFGAVLLNVNGKVGLLEYMPIRKQVMFVAVDFMIENMNVRVRLVTRLGLKPHEVQMANVELMRLLNAIEFN
ncbi:hypothetical protein [Vibrio nigripulchritudo]|uniref:hypothetical protein n=1 Tax=Vibrio nigripulchritudo TaxID=28173 RepID=UPI0003B22AFB|nr:hypothetical protein [Vibrio nigripulchritudo]CCN70113.1 exported hypothetical protein [Vibrio nigripulchritudo SFn118]